MAHTRVRSRSRGEEATVGLGYLQDLHQLYEELIYRFQAAHMREEEDLPVRESKIISLREKTK